MCKSTSVFLYPGLRLYVITHSNSKTLYSLDSTGALGLVNKLAALLFTSSYQRVVTSNRLVLV